MFPSHVYIERRKKLLQSITEGIILFPGNQESPMNYSANTYHFRQDSSFLYYFGLDLPDLVGVIEADTGEAILFGNDFEMDDIIWMGPQPTMIELAKSVGVKKSLSLNILPSYLENASRKNRTVHFLSPYRGETKIQLSHWLGIPVNELKKRVSQPLSRGVIAMRSVKEPIEIEELEKAIDISAEMHVTAMKMARPGIFEHEIAGHIEGIALSHGCQVSFPIILSVNGHILHNHYHGNQMKDGDLMLVDAGSESKMHYAGDLTRTTPVGGKFSTRQKEIYELVCEANMQSIALAKPGITNLELHLNAARIITRGLTGIGLMKGDVDEAVSAGAHALFFPHGLGHMLGLDVHDMEGLGENLVGYNDRIGRSEQFGLAYLRFGKELEKGYVITIEPGIYFIPALIQEWKKEKKHLKFINYSKVETYLDFGGIRVEDDILITDEGSRVLGKPVPKTLEEVEATKR